MQTNTAAEAASLSGLLDKVHVRQVLENYFHGLDGREQDRLEACFTDDVVATHHHGSESEFTINGRSAIARYFCDLMRKFSASTHTLSSTVIEIEGDVARADTFATVHIVSGERVRVRGIRYLDELARTQGGWLISRRTHTQLWQFEALAVQPFLPR